MRYIVGVALVLLALPGRLSADVVRYAFTQGTSSTDVLATVDVAAPPASENTGWTATPQDVLLWRILMRDPTGAFRFVEIAPPLPFGISSNNGGQLDGGSGNLFPPFSPVNNQPSALVSVSLSPINGMDTVSIQSLYQSQSTFQGNFTFQTRLSAIPEPSPLILGVFTAAAIGALTTWKRIRSDRAAA